MKLSVTTGIIAVSLLASAWTSSAESPPPLRRHRHVPQDDSSAAPSGVPRAPGLPLFPPQGNPQGTNPQFQGAPVMRGNPYQQALPPLVTPTPRKKIRGADEESRSRQTGASSGRQVPAGLRSKRESADYARRVQRSKTTETSRDEAQRSAQKRHTQTKPARSPGERGGTERPVVVPSPPAATPAITPQLPPEPVQVASPPLAPSTPLTPVQVPPQTTATAQPQSAGVRKQANEPVLPDLSEDERAKLHSAHQAALNDPNLAASRDRYLKARREFREKLRNALLKADPSVQPILEKIKRERRNEQ